MTWALLFCFCTILRKREILNWDVLGISEWDRNIIGIKVDKYKQIIPDNYLGRQAISIYDVQLPVAMATALKILIVFVGRGP